MRITTQMLNQSAKKAGLPINNTSLLNYVNNDSSENTLLSALNKSQNSAAAAVKKSNYEKLETAAEQLLQTAESFTAEGEESIFAKAKESGSNEAIYAGVEALVERYNSTIEALRKASTPLNDYYRQMLQGAATDNSEALSEIGVTISKDGTAVLDKDKLKAADIDSLEKVLKTAGDFSTKVAFLATRISDNAEANAESLTSQYNAQGNIYSTQTNKFDFWG